MGLSNQEGPASQGSLCPTSWWQQWQQEQLQRLHKLDCYLVSTPRAVGENNAHRGRFREVERAKPVWSRSAARGIAHEWQQ